MFDTLRNIVEIGLGLVYLIGAVFNVVYTFRHGAEFYGSFADGAWLRPSGGFVRSIVIPNSKLFTSLLVVFQLVVAAMILSRGSFAVYGLIAGAVFSFAAVFVSNVPGAIANLALAVVQAFLALMR